MAQPVQGEQGGPQRPRTYAEIINDSWTSEEDQKRAKADSLLGHMAALLFQRGDTKHVQLLLLIRSAVIEWDDETQSDDLWLEFDPGDSASFTEEAHQHLRGVFHQVTQRLNYGVPWLISVKHCLMLGLTGASVCSR